MLLEHILENYAMEIELDTDFIEADLVLIKDGYFATGDFILFTLRIYSDITK